MKKGYIFLIVFIIITFAFLYNKIDIGNRDDLYSCLNILNKPAVCPKILDIIDCISDGGTYLYDGYNPTFYCGYNNSRIGSKPYPD